MQNGNDDTAANDRGHRYSRRSNGLVNISPAATQPRIQTGFMALIQEYLLWAARQRSYRSKCDYIKVLTAYFGDIPISSFSVLGLERFQADVLAKGRKPATANRYLATLMHMFTKAVSWELMDAAQLARLRAVKLIPENNKRLRYLTREEADRLAQCCNLRIRPIVLLALHSGMRRGEVLRLGWNNVDIPGRLILLGQDQTKSGRHREIPLNDTALNILQTQATKASGPWVFPAPSGRPYLDVKRSFKAACQKAKIENFRFHDLRHSFASWLVMAGADLATVKELLGHATLMMTLRYAHLSPGHKAQAVRLLDGPASPPPGIPAL